MFWLTEKANYQEFVSERPSADPVHAYFKVKTENIGYGELVKTDKSSGVKLKGAVYGIYSDSGCTNKVDTMTTDGNGYAKSKALVAGMVTLFPFFSTVYPLREMSNFPSMPLLSVRVFSKRLFPSFHSSS